MLKKKKMEPTVAVFMNNEQLKAANATEYVTPDELKRRVKEIKRCRKDVVYFAENYVYIVNLDKGKHIIKLYPKQRELIKMMCKENRLVTLAARQSGKSVSYSIVALWYVMFNQDKNILICANTGASASEFVGKIKMSYEMLPMWLKPGVVTWNARTIKFANGSSIAASPTSSAVRGRSANFIVLDEVAFIPKDVEEEFIQGVFPVLSSSKNTKLIMVSTPNGTGNFFYETYNRASLGVDGEGWKNFRIDWWEVPGRDDDWKKKQIATFNGDLRKFQQEYGCVFHGSTCTLIDGPKLKDLKERAVADNQTPEQVQLSKKSECRVNVWERPKPGHAYVIGADVSEGVGGDFSTALVFDVTSTEDIRNVASYGNNMVSSTEFAFLLNNLGNWYNSAFIACERNGVSKSALDMLNDAFQYDSIVNLGARGMNIGIVSGNTLKTSACVWFKDLFNMPEIKVSLRDKNLVYELEYFEKKSSSSAKSLFCAANGKHDDYAMAAIWGLYMVNPSNAENYFNVSQYFVNSFGLYMPRNLTNSVTADSSSRSRSEETFEQILREGEQNSGQGDFAEDMFDKMRKTVGDSDDKLPGEQFDREDGYEDGYEDDPFGDADFIDSDTGGF